MLLTFPTAGTKYLTGSNLREGTSFGSGFEGAVHEGESVMWCQECEVAYLHLAVQKTECRDRDQVIKPHLVAHFL